MSAAAARSRALVFFGGFRLIPRFINAQCDVGIACYQSVSSIGIISGAPISSTLRAHIGEVAMMAAIVTTLLFVPAAVLVAGSFFVFGFSLPALATFNGALNAYLGVAAWWLIAFLPTLVYSTYVMPWEPGRP